MDVGCGEVVAFFLERERRWIQFSMDFLGGEGERMLVFFFFFFFIFFLSFFLLSLLSNPFLYSSSKLNI